MCVSKIKQNCFCKSYLIPLFLKAMPVSGASMHQYAVEIKPNQTKPLYPNHHLFLFHHLPNIFFCHTFGWITVQSNDRYNGKRHIQMPSHWDIQNSDFYEKLPKKGSPLQNRFAIQGTMFLLRVMFQSIFQAGKCFFTSF